jgi:hypothetical protein
VLVQRTRPGRFQGAATTGIDSRASTCQSVMQGSAAGSPQPEDATSTTASIADATYTVSCFVVCASIFAWCRGNLKLGSSITGITGRIGRRSDRAVPCDLVAVIL